MNTKFIDFEGIHGCGKSTTACILNKNLCNESVYSKVCIEADADNPYENSCDFRFMSIVDDKEFGELINQNPQQSDLIRRSIKRFGDYYLLYYPGFNNTNDKLMKTLLNYQVYEGRFDSKTFKKLMLKRFNDFVEKALQDNIVYIFESVVFQHIINELLRFGNLTPIEISEYISKIADALKPLNPILFHLRVKDVKKNIDKIASERLSDNLDLYPDWIDFMVQYVKNSNYGERNNVQNREDVIEYFNTRAGIENKTFDMLNVHKHIINVDTISKEELNHMVYKTIIK